MIRPADPQRNAGRGRNRRDGVAGQALAETAILVPVILLIMLSLFDLGRVVYAQNAITNNARAAVRVAVVDAAYSSAKYAEIRDAARRISPLVAVEDAAITGDPGDCPTPNEDMAAPGTCFYADPPGGDGLPAAGDRVEVNISITVPLTIPIISSVVGGSFSLTAKSVGFVQCSGC